MDGRIGVESEQGQGSSFWFDVPLPVVAIDVGTSVEASTSRRKSLNGFVLLVDDTEMNRDVGRQILERFGLRVVCVASGPEAIEAVQRSHYDIVLMDIQMPLMDGIAAAKQIRSLGEAFDETPIIAMTAHVLPSQVAHYLSVGMSDHIGKPFDVDLLFDKLAYWLSASRSIADGDESSFDPKNDRCVVDHIVFDQGASAKLNALLGADYVEGHRRTFLRQLEQTYTEDAFRSANAPELKRLAHTATSGAGLLGYKTFALLCAQLDEACVNRGDLEPFRERVITARHAVVEHLSSTVAL